MDRCVWVLCQALDSPCCSKQLCRAGGQSQLLGPRGRVLAHGLTRWLMTGKGVGARDRSGGREGVRREVGKMDGWLLELEAGSCGRGCPREQMVGSAGGRRQMCQARSAIPPVTFRALMCTFFVCGQLGRNLFALPQKMKPL